MSKPTFIITVSFTVSANTKTDAEDYLLNELKSVSFNHEIEHTEEE